MTFQRGRFTVSLYADWSYWTWLPHAHSRPCCYFWFEWGPFEIGVCR